MGNCDFSKNLTFYRKEAGYTQADLAELLQLNQRTISAWEKGICQPSLEKLIALKELFNITFDDLLL